MTLGKNKKTSTKKLAQCKKCGHGLWKGDPCPYCSGDVLADLRMLREPLFVRICAICEMFPTTRDTVTCSPICNEMMKKATCENGRFTSSITREEAIKRVAITRKKYEKALQAKKAKLSSL